MSERSRPIFEQSAVIPYRRENGRLEVLLVTSHRRRRWVIPKGLLEPGLSPRASAAKEALEEAGVQGRVHERAIGRYEYQKWGGVCRVEVFPLEVDHLLSVWEESHRDRSWLSVDEAADRVREADLAVLLRSLPRHLTDEESEAD